MGFLLPLQQERHEPLTEKSHHGNGRPSRDRPEQSHRHDSATERPSANPDAPPGTGAAVPSTPGEPRRGEPPPPGPGPPPPPPPPKPPPPPPRGAPRGPPPRGGENPPAPPRGGRARGPARPPRP